MFFSWKERTDKRRNRWSLSACACKFFAVVFACWITKIALIRREFFIKNSYNSFHYSCFKLSYFCQDPPSNATSVEAVTTNQGNYTWNFDMDVCRKKSFAWKYLISFCQLYSCLRKMNKTIEEHKRCCPFWLVHSYKARASHKYLMTWLNLFLFLLIVFFFVRKVCYFITSYIHPLPISNPNICSKLLKHLHIFLSFLQRMKIRISLGCSLVKKSFNCVASEYYTSLLLLSWRINSGRSTFTGYNASVLLYFLEFIMCQWIYVACPFVHCSATTYALFYLEIRISHKFPTYWRVQRVHITICVTLLLSGLLETLFLQSSAFK